MLVVEATYRRNSQGYTKGTNEGNRVDNTGDTKT